MIQFLVHEKDDSVGVATVDIKAEENSRGFVHGHSGESANRV